jgi:hypothetical protein
MAVVYVRVGLAGPYRSGQSLSEISKNFSGSVAFANDLDCFPYRKVAVFAISTLTIIHGRFV